MLEKLKPLTDAEADAFLKVVGQSISVDVGSRKVTLPEMQDYVQSLRDAINNLSRYIAAKSIQAYNKDIGLD